MQSFPGQREQATCGTPASSTKKKKKKIREFTKYLKKFKAIQSAVRKAYVLDQVVQASRICRWKSRECSLQGNGWRAKKAEGWPHAVGGEHVEDEPSLSEESACEWLITPHKNHFILRLSISSRCPPITAQFYRLSYSRAT